MPGERENQFSSTRTALSTGERAKSKFLSVISNLLLVLASLAAIHQTQGTTAFPLATNSSVIETTFSAATSGSNYLVGILSGTNIAAQLFSTNGTLLGAQLSLGKTTNTLSAVPVAFGRTNYLVTWTDTSVTSGVDLFGQLVSVNGAKVGAVLPLLQTLGTHGPQSVQAVGFAGTNFLAVWEDEAATTFYGQWVTAAGALSGQEFLLSGSQHGARHEAAVAPGATNCLVLWENHDAGSSNLAYVVLVSTAGPTTVTAPLLLSQTASLDHNLLTAAFDGTNYLAVWNADTNLTPAGAPVWNLYGRLVSSAGATASPELLLSTNQPLFPSLAFDGSNYLLGRSYNLDTTNANKDMRFRFLNRSATPLGPEFNIFPAQGTNVPLFGPVLFDGVRFSVMATIGSVQVNGSGAFSGFSSGAIYGAFLPKSSALPRLDVTGPLAGGHLPLLLTGTPGINYALQMTTKLAPANWTSLATNSPTNGAFSFTDLQATNPARFYRAARQ